MIYLLTPFLLYIIMLSFIKTRIGGFDTVVFLSPPSLFFFAYLILLLVINVSLRSPSFNAKSKKENYIYLLYVSAILFLWGLKRVFQGDAEGWLLYFFLMVPFYFTLFILLFEDVKKLIVVAKLFCIAYIVLSFVMSAIEYYQFNYLGWSPLELWNRSGPQYNFYYVDGGWRMLGLTGNPTFNAVGIVLAYIGYLWTNQKQHLNMLGIRHMRRKFTQVALHLMMLTIVLHSASGLGWIILIFFYVFNYLGRRNINLKLLKIFLIFFTILSFTIIIFDFFEVHKGGSNYIIWNIERLTESFLIFFRSDTLTILFGADVDEPLYRIDKGITLPLMAGGLFFFITLSLFYYAIYKRAGSYLKYIILLFLLGSIHYPVGANQAMQVLIGMLLAIEYLSRYKPNHCNTKEYQ
jgi:hypothetical protein